MNTHLFAIGMASSGLSTSFQIPIPCSWASSVCTACSHSGHSGDCFASSKLFSSSSPNDVLAKVANICSADVNLSFIISASSSSGKGSLR
jgi:hypothetical protein